MQCNHWTYLFTRGGFFLTIQAPSPSSCRRKYWIFFYYQIYECRGLNYPKFIIGEDNFATGIHEMTSQEKSALVSCHRFVNWWINLKGKKIQASEELFLRSKMYCLTCRIIFQKNLRKRQTTTIDSYWWWEAGGPKCMLLSPYCLLRTF